MKDDTDEYYYAHDHLYSPAVLTDSSGTVVERYEYDAYGKPTIFNAGLTTERANSNYGNPYLFTGRRVDILDSGSLKLQYNRNRYYDYYSGRWLTHDPLGITPNPQLPNGFKVIGQYGDAMNLYEYAKSLPTNGQDPQGLVGAMPDPWPPDPPPSPFPSPPPLPEPLSLDCPDGGCPSSWLDPLPSSGRSDDWSAVQAQWHFHFGGGAHVEFNHLSTFAWRCSVPTPATSVGINVSFHYLSEELKRQAKTIGRRLQPCGCAAFSSFGIAHRGYVYVGDHNWDLTLSRGENDAYSKLYYRPKCCLKKICLDGIFKIKLVCRIRWDIYDLWTWETWPAMHSLGNDYWQIVHFDKNLNVEIDL